MFTLLRNIKHVVQRFLLYGTARLKLNIISQLLYVYMVLYTNIDQKLRNK